MTTEDPTGPDALARIFRSESGVVLASLIARYRDFDLAEDALQDAFALALSRWPREGVPDRPAAWLTTTARNRVVDRLRHHAMQAGKSDALRRDELLRREPAGRFVGHGPSAQLHEGLEDEGMEPLEDERLRLIFTCCHPALSREAQVALTLKTLGGLTTAEVARAFLTSDTTMGRRLARAKRKIRDAKIPYRVPSPDKLAARLDSVLAVLYLIFNEGFAARSGDAPVRRELSSEAIRLARILASLLDGHAEALGLLALMLLHDSRSSARVDGAGNLVPLELQDRSLWDGEQIADGLAVLERARPAAAGPYCIQARISATHARSRATGATDWAEIVTLYDDLESLSPSPVIALNRAVAVSRADGALAGLLRIDAMMREPGVRKLFEDYQPYHAACADLNAMAGNVALADAAYGRAIDLTEVQAERDFLTQRRAALWN